MADIKWIKLATNMHDDEKMKLMDAMPERDTIHYLWIRLLIQAGKTNANGLIYLNENIPYTDEMLATIFSRPVASIRFALKVLSDLQMIKIAENNVIKIVNWDKHQNVEGMDRVRDQNRKRVQNHREKKKQLEAEVKETPTPDVIGVSDSCNVTDDKSNVTVTEQNKRETKNKKEIKNENKKEREIKKEENRGYKQKETPTHKVVEVSDSHKKQVFGSLIKASVSELSSNSQSQSKSLSQSKASIIENNKNLEDINTKCIELIKYSETITGISNVFNLGALKLAIGAHGHQYVKMAVDIALKANKPNMTYIDGILKNWRREGYPDDKEVKKNGTRSFGKNSNPDKNEFTGFKPKKPRSLTEEQRKKAEETLI
ncbi:DnaD domain protein [Clostridium chromiireducens]|uniref:DnaD domain protein n=1 Tax=Clostridium chromiireducens TaxID=225345 RepID=A0A964RJI4_9CLOT|nr:phage replisome organizer N-terminal domain-containing protein [Clostridium chromiireducens]MVX62687.1 DnaD domain protein [Clostridium chromiireducens]